MTPIMKRGKYYYNHILLLVIVIIIIVCNIFVLLSESKGDTENYKASYKKQKVEKKNKKTTNMLCQMHSLFFDISLSIRLKFPYGLIYIFLLSLYEYDTRPKEVSEIFLSRLSMMIGWDQLI